jgi:hypothetical protein
MKYHLSLAQLFLLLITLGVSAGCFPRECQENANCVRSCDCLDSVTKSSTNCAMTFLCNAEERSCEEKYDMDCDELCATYAANDLCGSSRCTLDSECVRTATCQVTDAQGATQETSCSQGFLCDDNTGTCEAASIVDELSFCQLCLTQAISQ